MDKTKLRIKRKRQQERRREREAEVKDLTDRLSTMFREKGYNLKNINPKAVMREYNNIQRSSTATAICYNTICTLYCMRKLYGYGKLRLFRLATEITVRQTPSLPPCNRNHRKSEQRSDNRTQYITYDRGLKA